MPDPESIQRDKATILAIIKYLLFAGIAAAVIYFGFWLFGILLPFVFGFVLAQVANGLAKLILGLVYRLRHPKSWAARKAAAQVAGNKSLPSDSRSHWSYPRGLARSRAETRLAIAIYGVELAGLAILVVVIINGGISQLRSLATYLPDLLKNADISDRVVTYLKGLSESLGGFLPPEFLLGLQNELAAMQQRLIQAVPDVASYILQNLASFIGFLPLLLFIIIVVMMSGYYFTAQSRFLYTFLHRNITSKSFREKSVRLVSTLSKSMFRVIGGYIFLLLVTFVMALGGLLIIRMPYPVIFAIILAIVDLLPVLGIGTTMIPISIYMFISGNVFGGIGALVLMAIMIIIRRIIEPPVMGNALKLHPMSTLAAMIIGIGVYGVGGIILGPIIFVIGREIMIRYGFDVKLRDMVGNILNNISP